MIMNKKVKLFTAAVVVVLIAVSIVTANKYLSDKHLFVYATGTNDKAFLNATWKMSPQEIERANKTTLSDSSQRRLNPITTSGVTAKNWRDENPFEEWPFNPFTTPEVTDQNRFKILVQKNVFLFGHDSEVEYYLFDNMLYGFHIFLTANDLEKTHKEILETLRKQFGAGKEEMERPSSVIYNFNWETETQTVFYKVSANTNPMKGTYSMRIWSLYKPFFRQIEDVAKKEKKTYF